MIKANFNTYNSYVTDSLYQWDVNQDLVINGLNLSTAPEIHFANADMDRAIVRQSTFESGVVTVRIPNSLLQAALTIKAYVGIYEGETFKVIETIEIPVIAKTKPADYTIEDSDEEIYSFKALENEIANAKKEIADRCEANRVEMVATVEKATEDLESSVEETTNTLNARVDNIIAHNNDTTGNSELLDMRVDFNGNTYASAGDAVRAIGGVVTDLQKQNGMTLTNGKFVYSANGAIANDANYGISDLIPCYPGATFAYRGESSNQYIYVVAFYDRDKKFVSGLSNTGASDTILNGVVPDDCWHMRLTYRVAKIKTAKCALDNPVFPEWIDALKEELKATVDSLEIEQVVADVAQIKGRIIQKSPTSGHMDSMVAGEQMILQNQTSVKQNTSLRFFAKIDSLDSDFVLYLGIGATKTSAYGEYIKITPTALAFMQAGTSGGNIPHGITEFKDYLFVSVSLNNEEKATVQIRTNGDSYTQNDVAWVGNCGAIFAELESGAELSDCELTWNSSDFSKKVWLFGDSYFTYWPKQLRAFGYNTVLLNGYPGETSASGLRDFKSCLEYGTPQFAVWCLGMNNADTSTAVNAEWLSCVQEFIEICENKGITPILSTIPCVTNTGYKNERKNAWVRNSGYRYVDFANAVNGLVDGQGWYEGMLLSDNVHPAVEGSRVLAARVLTDIPEINHE